MAKFSDRPDFLIEMLEKDFAETPMSKSDMKRREYFAKTDEMNFRWFDAFDPSEIQDHERSAYSKLVELKPNERVIDVQTLDTVIREISDIIGIDGTTDTSDYYESLLHKLRAIRDQTD